MRESRDCRGRALAGRGEDWLSLRQDHGAPVICRAVEEEKVVLRVHDFRPDVKKVVRKRREVKRCITEESYVLRSSLSPPASPRGSWVFLFEILKPTDHSTRFVRRPLILTQRQTLFTTTGKNPSLTITRLPHLGLEGAPVPFLKLLRLVWCRSNR